MSPNLEVKILIFLAYNLVAENNKLTKVAQMSSPPPVTRAPYPEHPNRCQGKGPHGQCTMLVLAGDYCKIHGGATVLDAAEKSSMKRYDIARWRDKIARHAEDDQLKNLSAEVGVLRMIVEEKLRKCENDVDLMTEAPMIADMVLKIDKLVNSCHRLDDKLGNLLDKNAIINFASLVVEIVSNNITDPTKVAAIADQIAATITKEKHDHQ